MQEVKKFYNNQRQKPINFDSLEAQQTKHSPEFVIDFAERYLLHVMSNVGIQTHAENRLQKILEVGNDVINLGDTHISKINSKRISQDGNYAVKVEDLA